jgi:hypothetical protein
MSSQAFLTNLLPSQSASHFRAVEPLCFDAKGTDAIFRLGRDGETTP